MREFFRNIVAAVFAVAISTTAMAASDLPTFQKQAVDTVVQLNRSCSGVVLDTSKVEKLDKETTYIITANHCVDGEESGYVTIDKKDKQKVVKTEQYVFDVIRRAATKDLAFLRLREKGLSLPSAVLDTKDPVEGQEVWTVGYPLGLNRTITAGFFGGFANITKDMRFDEFGNGRPVYRASPAIYGGNSGGGMFINDGGQYKLVGITDAGFPSFFVAGFYNPQEDINEIVNSALEFEVKEQDKEKPDVELNGWASRGEKL
jgi:S1-C subfamily serine protease